MAKSQTIPLKHINLVVSTLLFLPCGVAFVGCSVFEHSSSVASCYLGRKEESGNLRSVVWEGMHFCAAFAGIELPQQPFRRHGCARFVRLVYRYNSEIYLLGLGEKT